MLECREGWILLQWEGWGWREGGWAARRNARNSFRMDCSRASPSGHWPVVLTSKGVSRKRSSPLSQHLVGRRSGQTSKVQRCEQGQRLKNWKSQRRKKGKASGRGSSLSYLSLILPWAAGVLIQRRGTAPGPPGQPAEVEKRTWGGQSLNIRGELWLFLHYPWTAGVCHWASTAETQARQGTCWSHSPLLHTRLSGYSASCCMRCEVLWLAIRFSLWD